MIFNNDELVEILGKKYRLNNGYEECGPFYSEQELKDAHPDGLYPEYWDNVDDAPVLCGKCRRDTFKVSHCSSNYETWVYCSCGNRFVVHSG